MTQHPESQDIPSASIEPVCPTCGHSTNAPTATTCEKCGQVLKGGKRRFDRSKLAISGLSLAGLLLVVGGVAWIWKPWNPQAWMTSQSGLNPASEFQFYPTMRDVPNVPKGDFSYNGALVSAALTANGMNDAIAQAHPDFRLRAVEPPQGNPGSGRAIQMLIDGNLNFAQTLRTPNDAEYAKAQARNVKLEQLPVGIDGVVFFTHKDLSLPGLSIDQLQNIYRGKITNWREVGGPDLPIVPFSLDPATTAAIRQLLESNGEDVGRNVRVVRDYAESLRQVTATPGSISFTSASFSLVQQPINVLGIAKVRSKQQYVLPLQTNKQINTAVFRDGSYPLTRRLFVIIRRDGTPNEQVGVAYANLLLSKEGQKIIEKAGLVPLY